MYKFVVYSCGTPVSTGQRDSPGFLLKRPGKGSLLTDRLLLRVSEAARLADVSRTTAYQLIASGQWPCIRIMGSAMRVPTDGLRAWIEQEVQKARSTATSTTSDRAK